MEKEQFISEWERADVFNQFFKSKNLDYTIINSYFKGLDSSKFNPNEYLYILDLNELNFLYFQDHTNFKGNRDVKYIDWYILF